MSEAVVKVLMKICIPWIPPVRMSPNRGTPTRTVKRYRAVAKEAACMAIRDQLRGRCSAAYAGPVHFTFTVCWPKGRHVWDADNLSACMKSLIDSFEAEGIIVNDRQADAPTIRQSHDDGQGYVYVELTTRAAAREAA